MHNILEAVSSAQNILYHGRDWKCWHDEEMRDGQIQIDVDHFLLTQHFEEKIPSTIRIWQNHPSLVLSKRDVANYNDEDTFQYFRKKGTPLFHRSSGGTVVPHGPNVLNISLIFSENDCSISLT